ncbi:Aste57867_3819 [Aphanomyces stellatus]|uniref:Aste57867_3819 protein n=1 Tax=Aphanomyces stellatus TaxID=120398 RepID=A0A485KFU5_9STRA|nr:hypothetical protein As57867_003808 [Aphanomyces stellatus]VFT80968.1 Aste57867_3819 [Aphanomyces stellatus]
MKDSNTFTSAFAAEYLSVVDQVVAAAVEDIEDDEDTTELINTSRGPRVEEPTVAKIMQAVGDFSPDLGLEDTPADWDPFGATQVLNPGQSNVMFLWGDSHGNQVKPRLFHRLKAHHHNSSKTFPTIYFRSFDGTAMLPCINNYTNMVDAIKALQPKVLLHSINWQRYLRPTGSDADESTKPHQCCTGDYVKDKCQYQRPKDVVAILNQFQKDMAELTSLGIRVFIATMNPEGDQFDPKHMLSGDEVGDVRPVLKSAYREVHKELVGLVEAAIHGANATLLDYSDNYCWEDVCQVVDMYGNPIMKDNNHLRTNFGFKYLSVVDQAVSAAMA